VFACLATFCSFASFYLLLPTLPVYILAIGGSESEVGLLIGVFSATAVLLRLLIGRASDTFGRRGFILGGFAVLTASSALYMLAQSVPSLLLVRMVHGAGWAACGTAINALVADIVPASRRGEALGYFGMFSSAAMGIGPAVGVALMKRQGFDELFVVAALIALMALLLGLGLRESARRRGAVGEPALMPVLVRSAAGARQRGALGGLIEVSALFPSGVLALATAGYGAIVAFISIFATRRGLDNPGWFFSVYALTLVLSRGFLGRLSDRHGRAAVIVPGLLLTALCLALLPVAHGVAAFLALAAVYGLGFAAMQPALMALVVDRSSPGRRGPAMGMFATAMDLGIGAGSLVFGLVAAWGGYELMYRAAAGLTLVTVAWFVAGSRAKSPANGARHPP